MRYRIFDLSDSKLKSGIDDEPLQRLLYGHEVVSRRERFYFHDGLPHLVVSVLYRLATLPGSQQQGKARSDGQASACPSVSPRKETKEDWRELLREEDAPLFESLRAWRTQRARADAVPPYVILTNVQLARIVNGRPVQTPDPG